MISNHAVFAWWEIIPLWLAYIMYIAGGVTFPIMAYFVVEGYRHTSNLKKYMLRLLLFGMIAFPFHSLVMGNIMFNIMFTILVGLISILLYELIKIRFIFWVLFVLVAILTSVPISFDWPIIGVVVILMFHIIKSETKRRILPPIVAGIFFALISGFGIWSIVAMKATPGMEAQAEELIYSITIGRDMEFLWVTLSLVIGTFFSVFLLKNYNGERGKQSKWLFYIIYPLHLAVLSIVALLFGWVDFSIFGI